MLSRTQMRHFLAVVDTGSFTRAAHALNIAQPSLSGGIAELERQLGTRLFVRERRRIGLTAAGNALLPMARAIEAQFHDAEARIGAVPVPARPIRLGVLDTVSTAWIEATVARYAGDRPLELTEGGERELASALATGSIDLALTLLGGGRRSEGTVLLEEDYCLALPASHPLAAASTIRATDVAGETMIARRACEVLGETSRFFTTSGVRPRFALRSAHDDRAMALVRAGLGVTVAPRSLGIAGVTMVPISDFGLRRRIGLVSSQSPTNTLDRDNALVQVLEKTAPRFRVA
ncbi:LysR family transcriptional regulator [Novosphingobium kunmingense]|uniref:LysR family transcriptional regulator n=1 Tax=Novosphingobium kunmingense TaxID=1211806 RepID=A0A2N0H5C2_9SPHN|nr:LysR family transcriptional regulator [Novosphingobium kunmingense]PKB14138.1 LysR family transcriptional regulator [Novosphingobium kunmingense]